jgi:hypothetical protein
MISREAASDFNFQLSKFQLYSKTPAVSTAGVFYCFVLNTDEHGWKKMNTDRYGPPEAAVRVTSSSLSGECACGQLRTKNEEPRTAAPRLPTSIFNLPPPAARGFFYQHIHNPRTDPSPTPLWALATPLRDPSPSVHLTVGLYKNCRGNNFTVVLRHGDDSRIRT